VTAVGQLTVPGDLDSLKSIREYVVRAAESAGLDKKGTYRLNLAVDEVATNIILHAYQEADLKGDVLVRKETDHKTLTVVLEDTGAEYDPSQINSPEDLDQPLENRDEGGLGLFLTTRNVDHFTYQRVDGRNIHTFVMNLDD
jgi:anti-sigma regulatory factor (Ser/Thr protein kinase)